MAVLLNNDAAAVQHEGRGYNHKNTALHQKSVTYSININIETIVKH